MEEKIIFDEETGQPMNSISIDLTQSDEKVKEDIEKAKKKIFGE